MKLLSRSNILFLPLFWGCLCVPLGLVAGSGEERLGLPPVPIPKENVPSVAKVALGQKLFFDKRLSQDGLTSCASCHQPERAFSDGLPVAKGIGGRSGTRNTPSLLNAAFNSTQFWDGRRSMLEDQALDPFFNPREHGLLNDVALFEILRQDKKYVSAFRRAFPDSPDVSITAQQVGQAIASFERTLIAGNSPFDQYFFKGDRAALSNSAKNGLALFLGRAKCAACHKIEEDYALFTDNQFHSLNIGLQRIAPRLAEITKRLAHAKENGNNLDQTVISDEDVAELGRFAVTLKPSDIGTFRTPGLRNVARTAPYMHDGSVATLEEAVELELYYRSAEAGRPLILTPVEKADLVAFLKSLNSEKSVSFIQTKNSVLP